MLMAKTEFTMLSGDHALLLELQRRADDIGAFLLPDGPLLRRNLSNLITRMVEPVFTNEGAVASNFELNERLKSEIAASALAFCDEVTKAKLYASILPLVVGSVREERALRHLLFGTGEAADE